jgi:hypothetical protein
MVAHVFDGFGVALAVQPVDVDWSGAESPAGVGGARPARLGEVLPVAERSPAEVARELQQVERLEAVLRAYKAELVLGLAAHRPAEPDRPDAPWTGGSDRSPVPGASEFFVEELAVVLNCSPRAAARLAEEAFTLRRQLPAVWEALADGQLDLGRARVFADVLGPARPEVAHPVTAQLLPGAGSLSVGRLRAALTRAVLTADAAFAEQRRAAAQKSADVRTYPTDAGMSVLVAELPTPVSAACCATVNELAWMRRHDGDTRPIGLLRALTMADLILRPWDTTRPPVTAALDVLAPLASLHPPTPGTSADAADAADAADVGGRAQAPGEVAGQPITAGHLRELLTQLDAVCPGGLQAPAGGSLQVSITGADGALLATTTRPELERLTRAGCPDHLHRATDCGCPLLGPPPAVDRYTPSPAQQRFTRARDRTCRHPGCGQPAARADLDHCLSYADGGATTCTNLCCLCRRHHRLKTFAVGWRFVLTDQGVLQVTTPSGVTRCTRPPGLHGPTDLPALPPPPGPPAWAHTRPEPPPAAEDPPKNDNLRSRTTHRLFEWSTAAGRGH